jgi:hypothetical protein
MGRKLQEALHAASAVVRVEANCASSPLQMWESAVPLSRLRTSRLQTRGGGGSSC